MDVFYRQLGIKQYRLLRLSGKTVVTWLRFIAIPFYNVEQCGLDSSSTRL